VPLLATVPTADMPGLAHRPTRYWMARWQGYCQLPHEETTLSGCFTPLDTTIALTATSNVVVGDE